MKPASLTPYYSRGFTYAADFQFKKSVQDLTKYLKLGGKLTDAYYLRGASYFQLNFLSEAYADSALTDLNKFLSIGKDVNKAYAFIGGAYAVKGDSSNARRCFLIALEHNPDDLAAFIMWGKAENKFGHFARSIQLLNEYLARSRKPDSDVFSALALSKIGLCNINGAMNDFAKALEIDSLNLEAYEGRFALLFDPSKYNNDELIISDINHLLRLAQTPSRKASLYASRSLVNLRLSRFKEALSDTEMAIRLLPQEGFYYVLRGLINESTPLHADSILSDYDKAIGIKDSYIPYFAKAYYYRSHNETKLACANLKLARKKGAKITPTIEEYICKGGMELKASESAVRIIGYQFVLGTAISTTSTKVKCKEIY